MPDQIVLDGESLTVQQVVAVSREFAKVSVSPDAAARLSESRETIERAIAGGEVVYGVNTGFGKLADVRIADDQLEQLQRNLVRSHVAGVGPPLPVDVVRGIMLLRANVLLKPTSGVRPVLAEKLAVMLNHAIHPLVPEQGSVGASGDLAPLSHLAFAMMGEGEVVVCHSLDSANVSPMSAAAAFAEIDVDPITFGAKEGLSFLNGTQAQSAILALLVHDALSLWRSALAATAASLEALRGTPVPFDSRIHETRPHAGQIEAAKILRELLVDSEIRKSHEHDDPRVQDAYSLRCAPQVLGSVRDAIEFCKTTIDVELNSSTDNPLVFGSDVLSGGNFHGQPVALALDVLSIALTTLAGISERRTERLVNPDLSQGLPAFLTEQAGIASGFMIVQVTAAAIVAECRSLCMPASVQSIPTGAAQEDIVPMGMAAAMKARRIMSNAQRVVACELLCAVQGLEYLKPLEPGEGVRSVVSRIREVAQPYTEDRPHAPDIEAIASLLSGEAIA